MISNAAISDSNFAVTGSATVTIDGNTRNIDRWFFDDDSEGNGYDDWGFSIDSAFPALSAGLGVSWTGSINVSGVDLNDLNVGTYSVLDNDSSSQGFVNPLTLNISEAVVPEPSSLALLGIGGIALVGYGYRRKRTPVA